MSNNKSNNPNEWKANKTVEEHFDSLKGNKFGSINSSSSGSRFIKDLPKGTKSIQLYSSPTPNGWKASILLEELGVEYDSHLINISAGDQFGSGFVDVNPNSKIPCMVDYDPVATSSKDSKKDPVRLFESGSIMVYLSEKYSSSMLPKDPTLRAECMNWMFWGLTGLSLTFGNFGHFFVYAPREKSEAINYGVARYGMETLRLLDVLNKHLSKKSGDYIVGDSITLADISVYPWVITLDKGYKATSFLGLEKEKNRFPSLQKWLDTMGNRPAVKRGMKIPKIPKSGL